MHKNKTTHAQSVLHNGIFHTRNICGLLGSPQKFEWLRLSWRSKSYLHPHLHTIAMHLLWCEGYICTFIQHRPTALYIYCAMLDMHMSFECNHTHMCVLACDLSFSHSIRITLGLLLKVVIRVKQYAYPP